MLSAMFFLFFLLNWYCAGCRSEIYSNTLSWIHTHHHDPADPVSKQGAGEKNTHTEDIFYNSLDVSLSIQSFFCCGGFTIETITYLGYGLSRSSINWAVICRLLLHLLSKPHSFRKLICREWNRKWNTRHRRGVDRSIQSSFTVMELGFMAVLII